MTSASHFIQPIFGSHPVFQAYFESDFFGRIIFLSLFVLSVMSWVILVHKIRMLYSIRNTSGKFEQTFLARASQPLSIESYPEGKSEFQNPFHAIYKVLRRHTVEVLSKNRQEGTGQKSKHYLSPSDIDFVEATLLSAVSTQQKALERNLFLLSTVASLAPFLGLLGTVWGILLTFSELQGAGGGGSQIVLGGLSMALGTTVIGLVVAIPALVGHSYLKQSIRDFVIDMENFSSEMLAAVEMQYRKVDVD